MVNKNLRQSDSVLENLTGFRPKIFVIIVIVTYMSILTLPPVIASFSLPRVPAVIFIMLVQYSLLYYAGKLHGSSLLSTMKDNGFIGWIIWLAVICMLMLPVIHLLSLFGIFA